MDSEAGGHLLDHHTRTAVPRDPHDIHEAFLGLAACLTHRHVLRRYGAGGGCPASRGAAPALLPVRVPPRDAGQVNDRRLTLLREQRDPGFRTKPQLAAALVAEGKQAGFPCRAVVAD
nr:hypothetical protein [Streptomyces sp. WM6378]